MNKPYCVVVSDTDKLSKLKLKAVEDRYTVKSLVKLYSLNFEDQISLYNEVIHLDPYSIILNTSSAYFCSYATAQYMYDHTVRFYIQASSVKEVPRCYFLKPEHSFTTGTVFKYILHPSDLYA